MQRFVFVFSCVAIGFGTGFPAAFGCAILAGAGHGTYVPAKTLFPYTMLLTMVDGRISSRLIALALAQFPFYGLIIGLAAPRKQAVWIVSLVLVIIHVAAVSFCFAVYLPGFR